MHNNVQHLKERSFQMQWYVSYVKLSANLFELILHLQKRIDQPLSVLHKNQDHDNFFRFFKVLEKNWIVCYLFPKNNPRWW